MILDADVLQYYLIQFHLHTSALWCQVTNNIIKEMDQALIFSKKKSKLTFQILPTLERQYVEDDGWQPPHNTP